MSDSLLPLLASHELFSRLKPEYQQRLAGAARRRPVVPGEAICREGRPATTFFLLIEGTARVTCARPDGAQELLGLARPGSVLGLVGLGDASPRPATIGSVGPGVVMEFPRDLLDFAARTPDAGLAIALREVLCLALDLQLRAANQEIATRVDEALDRPPTDEWDNSTQGGGWKSPDD
ncbi:MAG: cyclic nucleotide-binding domain-containing protein [Proteobacteria bacterium]|nr:cyclic nucleotide-binding domain-containing protein [Pseudomonadota bacterium]MCP4915489.1 cyclic nucleotide-binding domain-containing protein [Pseudomonadota bacterium]